ncbi:UDP-N-acetylmuramoylalanyl-D-glutamyl-2,6- diaminopimelate--D-alanyl-D-alanine ligase [Actinokineospora spheciospongiae]|uniref:UDP-N-acetylmuramoyl-tripeptide--D-alanyl-D-alanine ligase n=1 Tax=Actinokineospora spheciospongiae TaxID=909613 RepID=W7JAD7_9PSEU|nr:UDP-N-acetylmuramoyl-tripeptide--D-alanyl-D-alanine ligase [Actinokineospora spheciospongiae]EWC63009.1 UDP-N-acetylmuramoylalanyl-D-glutamyl-2,6- diaminopimelate--D-alanyl-D-alanine ligase [Actinokineospora spheciospongiae]PWW62565.1 UDP-N-acetylmuramoyl-tripeptide--D-alanyl-D-alanine ligase [Actinokineospora spheciospongiae]
MIPLTLREVADAVGGRLHDADPDAVVTGTVEFDSRKITPGGLFLALPGEKVDGHDFAARAVAAGAVAVLAAREVDAPAVVVPPVDSAHTRSVALAGDTDGSGAAVLAALAALARVVVDRLTPGGLTVVGVTGSSGKTSTKDLIAQVLTPMGATVAPPGSFNSELGHPWTVLRADETTRHLVLELSARGPGHIAALCDTAPPRIGAVLNVGSAHLGEFGSREDIARTKGELAEKLPADGVAVLNADDPLVAAMAERTSARVVLVGEAPSAQVRAVDVVLDEQARATFRLVAPQGEATVSLSLHGAHHVGNALSAAAIALELGATPAEVAARLSGARRVSARRMEVITRPDGVTVVNDSYNANPESVRAALKTLATMARTGNRRRSWAVLGVMGELGDDSVAAHDEVGRLAVRLDINRLVVVGDEARAMHQGASLEGSWGEESVLVPDVDAAVALLRAELAPGDVVLVKASKVAALWRVADALLEAGR